jgi:hypothetical protein
MSSFIMSLVKVNFSLKKSDSDPNFHENYLTAYAVTISYLEHLK